VSRSKRGVWVYSRVDRDALGALTALLGGVAG
jgi:hypothetical protein